MPVGPLYDANGCGLKERVLLRKILECFPHWCHSWASAKLAGGHLMDLTDCGFDADSDGFF